MLKHSATYHFVVIARIRLAEQSAVGRLLRLIFRSNVYFITFFLNLFVIGSGIVSIVGMVIFKGFLRLSSILVLLCLLELGIISIFFLLSGSSFDFELLLGGSQSSHANRADSYWS